MKDHWAQIFLDLAKSQGIDCHPVRYSQGWLETAMMGGKRCYTKSMSYDKTRRQYFQGVDTGKLDETGDLVLLCGGLEGEIRDLFIIHWRLFFATLRKSEPINTYRDREYFQYKFYVRDRDDTWRINFQGGSRPILDVGNFRYDLNNGLSYFMQQK